MSWTFDRRQFIRFASGGAIGLATTGLSAKGISQLNAALDAEAVHVPKGPETWAPSICSMCPARCGLLVRKIGDRAVHVKGNPNHPVSRGGLCPKGLASLQELYHPGRLKHPIRNVGTRQTPKWKEVSWDEAIKAIAARIGDLSRSGRGHTVAALDAPGQRLSSKLLHEFVESCGSDDYLVLPCGADALQSAVWLQQGVRAPLAYDLDNSAYVLSFGVGLLEGWGSPLAAMRAFSRWRDPVAGRRTKYVQIESRLSTSAAKADEWVALAPGTEATLALGIAYVLIAEQLYDSDFVAQHTFGFEEWRDSNGTLHKGFRDVVLNDFHLEDVAARTGVPTETILRLAREAAANRPAIALGDWQTSTIPGNLYSAMAVHSLNALLGSFEVPGGVLLQPELPWANHQAAESDHAWSAGTKTVQRIRELAFSNKSTQVLLVNEVNPVFTQPDRDAYRTLLNDTPLVVAFTSFLNDTTALADFVLPTPTAFERWQDAGPPPFFPAALQSVSPPAVVAREALRAPADVLLELSRAIGGNIQKNLPHRDFESYLRHHFDQLFAAEAGYVFSPRIEETWNRMLERSGWWAPTYATAAELWEQACQQGGWWEPTFDTQKWSQVFKTASGKFEFCSQMLLSWAEKHPDVYVAAGLQKGDSAVATGHQPELAKASSSFPLLLVPFEVLALAGGDGAHLPYLQQIPGAHLFASWGSWLEIHPATAQDFGISDGEEVWVESAAAKLRVRARLYEGARPGIVYMPLGYGQRQGCDWACRGVNPLELPAERTDPILGTRECAVTPVRIFRS